MLPSVLSSYDTQRVTISYFVISGLDGSGMDREEALNYVIAIIGIPMRAASESDDQTDQTEAGA